MSRPKGSKNKPKKTMPPCPEREDKPRGRPAGSKNKTPTKKHDMTPIELAEYYKTVFICRFGIEDAEQIARLLHEKISASKQSLEEKYGKDDENS